MSAFGSVRADSRVGLRLSLNCPKSAAPFHPINVVAVVAEGEAWGLVGAASVVVGLSGAGERVAERLSHLAIPHRKEAIGCPFPE